MLYVALDAPLNAPLLGQYLCPSKTFSPVGHSETLPPSSAKITWDIPKDTQGFLFSYDLDYQIRGSLEEKEVKINIWII